MLLVGTKLDLPREREVVYEDALEVAEMHFGGAYVEVSAARVPFVGVDAVERFLVEWTAVAEEPSSAALSMLSAMRSEPQMSPALDYVATSPARSPKRKPCVRASVWLYDPTEDDPPSPEHDVKLRPISRALFEIRSAGQEKMKSLAKFKEREVGKLMQRSKYYGPTESSRHMRWQEEQRRTKQSPSSVAVHHSRQRSASHGAVSSRNSTCNRRREHELLDAKSFVQSTELLRQRKLELMARKALTAANASALSRPQTGSSRSHGTRSLANPQAARDAAPKQKRTRKFAGTTLSSVPEEDRCAPDDVSPPRSPTQLFAVDDAMEATTPQSSPSSIHLMLVGTSAFATELFSPDADQDAALPTPPPVAHLQSPIPPVASPSHAQRERRATIGDAPSSYSRSPFEFEDERMSGNGRFATRSVEATAVTRRLSDEQISVDDDVTSAGMNATSALVQTPVTPDELDLSADIDDMLDYFDGVTLPI